MGMMDKLKDAIGKNPDRARHAAHKAARRADEKTGGRYSDQIRRGQDKVDEQIQRSGESSGGQGRSGGQGEHGGSGGQGREEG